MRLLQRLRGQSVFAWAFADQIVSSAGNVLLLSQLSRGLGVKKFGVIAVVYGVILIIVAFFRALLSEVINSATHQEAQRDAADRAARILTLIASLIIICASIIAMVVAGTTVALLLVLALGVILIQDRVRWEWIYRRKTRQAFLIDATWTAGQVAFLAVFSASIL